MFINTWRKLLGNNSKDSNNYKIISNCKKENIEIKIVSNENISDINFMKNTSGDYFLESDIVQLDIEKNKIYLEYDEYYSLDEDERKILNLPRVFQGVLKIKNKGNFLNTNHGLKYEYSFNEGGVEYFSKYNGSYLSSNRDNAILKKEQYQIVKLIEKYNESEKIKDVEEQYRLLNKIREISKVADVVFNEEINKIPEIEIIDFMDIDFKEIDDETMEIVPKLKESQNELNNIVEKSFSNSGIVKKYYEVTIEGKKKNIVFDNELRNVLEVIKESGSKITKEKFLEKEGLIFNDPRMESENVEILYGPRVKGIGYLIYRKNPNIEKSGINWFEQEIPCIYTLEEKIKITPENLEYLEFKKEEAEFEEKKITVILDTDEGKKKLLLSSEELESEIDNLKNSIKDYKDFFKVSDLENIIILKENSGIDNKYIEYNGYYINVEDRIENIKNYRDELIKMKNLKEESNSNLKKGLIVKDNVENIEYSEKNQEENKKFEFQRPKSLKETIKLYEYQENSIGQFQELYLAKKSNGILLSDDMGLGKTLQILTFLAWLKERGECTPSLIIVPSSLIYNWYNETNIESKRGEIQNFFYEETFKVKIIKGKLKNDEIQEFEQNDIVLMTYETLRINHIETGKIRWKVIVCDEVQKIKNPATLVTNSIKSQDGLFKIACTATPIENTLIDLWCIVDFVKPGLLSSLKEFKNKYIRKNNSSKEVELNNEDLRVLNEQLKKKLGKYYIRRTKDILNQEKGGFPKKYLIYSPIEMSNEQKIIVNNYYNMKMSGKKAIELIQNMIMACSHPNLVRRDEVNKLVLQETEKLLKTKDILDKIKEKEEKVIIFTKYRKMQIILTKLIKEVYGFTAITINGEVENLRRKELLDEYKEVKGFNIIILSPEAAGVGLNIVEANHVIHYTRHWNPAKEDQATDRVYRINQKKDVYVYYPIVYAEKLGKKETLFNSYKEMNEYFSHYKTRLSPEENLNKIILKKKMMLEEFFLAVVPEYDKENLDGYFQ